MLIGAISYSLLYPKIGMSLGGRVTTTLVLLSYIVLINNIISVKDEKFKFINLLLLILLFIMPIGSGASFVNNIYVLPFILPLVLYKIYTFDNFNVSFKIFKKNLSLNSENIDMLEIKKMVFIIFCIFVFINNFNFTYDDSLEKYKLRYNLNNPNLAYVYTTEEKANALNELDLELKKYIKKGDLLLSLWVAPIVYFMSETVPFLPHPWSESYSEKVFKNLMMNNKKVNKLSVIVVEERNNKDHRYGLIFNQFKSKYKFEKIWTNNKFSIYKKRY